MQGRARDQVDVKGQLSYLPPTKAPPYKSTNLQPYSPVGGPISLAGFNPGWVCTRDEYIWWDFM